MIAITDPSVYLSVDYTAPTENIDLTEAVVNQHLTGSAIINSTITNAVKAMLVSILGNNNIETSAKTKLAKYAGFSLNTSVSPSTIEFDGNNASLDKLTFYVIFRLPYTHNNLTYDDIGNGDTSDTISGNPTSWGKYANYIRTLTGSGIKKINSAGEQVNNNGEPIDDNDNSIQGWYKKDAYEYLNVKDYLSSGEPKPFETGYQIPSGLYTENQEYNLFYGNSVKIPIYFYLLSHTENRYSPANWLNTNTDSVFISRVPHWPSNISGGNRIQHFMKTVNPSDMEVFTEDTSYMLHDDSNGYFIYVDLQKIYIEPIDVDALAANFLELDKVLTIQYIDSNLFAVWDIYENRILNLLSGLTLGMGIDLGASFGSYYVIEFDILISGTGNFQLFYGNKKSQFLNHDISNQQLKSTIAKLIDKINYNKVDLTIINITGGKKVSIVRDTQKWSKRNIETYNHKLYIGSTQGQIQVSITPAQDIQRWIPITNTINESWYLFSNLLDYSFSLTPTLPSGGGPYYEDPDTNETYFWLNNDALELTQLEKERLLLIFKKSFGNRKNGGIDLWEINKNLIKKLELKSYVLNMAASYDYFQQRFYNKNAIVRNGQLSRNYPVGSTIEELLSDSSLKTKPNQVELLAMSLYIYVSGGQEFLNKKSGFIEAINKHSFQKLKTTVSSMDKNRIKVIQKFYESVKSKLYHDLGN